MATRNVKPRGNGEGYIGTSVRKWLGGFFKNINVDTEAIVPTPANNDNSTKAATTAWVENVFFTKLVAKLLATTAATISSLSTSSLFYRFLAQALSVAGVQYNFSNSSAWYICLGSLFGGLIIQGGSTTVENVAAGSNALLRFNYPLSFVSGRTFIGVQTTVGHQQGVKGGETSWDSTQAITRGYNDYSSPRTISAFFFVYGR